MKGIIFTEFLEMVAQRFSQNLVDDLISCSQLATGGAYTEVGSYDCRELLDLLSNLSQMTHIHRSELLQSFGTYMFDQFVRRFSHYFEQAPTCFDFLASVDEHIHVEVRKLYPDAELPVFACTRPQANTFVMEYRSPRPLVDFANGLICAAIAYYQEPIDIVREDFDAQVGSHARFSLFYRSRN